MAGTLHMQIRNAVHQLLAAEPTLADGGVVKSRRRPVAAQYMRQIFVYLDTAVPDRAEYAGQPDDWQTRVRIECCARDDDGVTGEDNADDLATAVYARVMADPDLGGLVMDLIPMGMSWDSEEADTQLGVTQIVFDAKHRTSATSIAA